MQSFETWDQVSRLHHWYRPLVDRWISHFGVRPLLGIFEKKQHQNARDFAREFLPFGKCYGSGRV